MRDQLKPRLEPSVQKKLQQLLPGLQNKNDLTLEEERGVGEQMIINYNLFFLAPYIIGTVGAVTSLSRTADWTRFFDYIKPIVPDRYYPKLNRLSTYLPGGQATSRIKVAKE